MARRRDDIPERPASRDLRLLAQIGGFRKPYRGRIAIAAAALFTAAGCVLVLGQGLRRVIDAGFAAHDPASLDRALIGLLVVVGVLSIATFVRFYSVSWLGERITADPRRAVFSRILDLPPGFFESTRTGEVISRLTNDTALLEVVIGSSASFAVRNLLITTGSLVMLIACCSKTHPDRRGSTRCRWVG